MNRHEDEAQLPWSMDAEANVLGGLLQAPERLSDVVEWLQPEDFFRQDHGLLYQGVIELTDKGQPVDAVILDEWLEGRPGAESVPLGYPIQLQGGVISAANVVGYAEIVVEHSRRRRLVDLGQKLAQTAMNPRGQSAADIAARVTAAMSDFAHIRGAATQTYKQAMCRLGAAMNDRWSGGAALGMPTPWAKVNKAIGGLHDGDVIVLGARSNMGKSLLGFQLARFTAMRKQRVMVFSMEMQVEDVAARDVAAVGEVPHEWIMSDLQGEDSEIYWERTTRAIEQLTTLDGVIDEDPQLSALQVSARAKREHRKKPLRLVVVDHLHEMALPGKQGEVIERGQALRDLKALAKYLKCPVVVLAQLNRDGGDDGKRPQLKHLRGSGGIEEVADLVLLVHRPDYYNPNDRPGLVEVVVAKGRNVKTGSVIALQNRFDIMRADDWEGPEPEPLGQASQPSQQRPARQRRPLGQPMGRSRANGFQGDDA